MDKFKIFVSLLIILVFTYFAHADTIILADGRKLSGKFIKGDETKIVFISEGITMDLPRNLVSSISLGEEKVVEDTGKKSIGKGKIKGVITYYINRYQGYKPDLGAVVYACKTKVDIGKIEDIVNNIGRIKDIVNEKGIDDFIRMFCVYFSARNNRQLMVIDRTGKYHEKYQERLKQLGADTEEGWKKLESQGRRVLWDLEADRIPSEKATVGGDGTFSIELPPGNYFVIIKSKNRPLDDTCRSAKISGGETVDISATF